MARRQNNRGGNNNPTGRNQYSSDWGVMEMARERPFTTAAAAAAAVGAGVFLWSRRNQISEQLSEQISNLSDQIGEWTENMHFGQGGSDQFDDTAGLTTTGSAGTASGRGSSSTSRSGRGSSSGRGMSETGGGNASLGTQSGGGGGAASTASGRGRVNPAPTS
ncbi:MAG TPA: hypothetical protein VM308_09550 [Sphingomicrobium sp.]|nr:hypothetical protein [Sphingomicrobium sp.]